MLENTSKKKTRKKRYSGQWVPYRIMPNGNHAWVYEGRTVTNRSNIATVKIAPGNSNQMITAFEILKDIYDVIEFDYSGE